MKALLKNKRTRLGVIATLVGVAILLTALTLAFFTNTGSAGSGDVTVGSLRVKAELDEVGQENMGPGWFLDGRIGTITNSGTLDTLIQLDFNYEITIKSDSNGDPLDPADYYSAPADQDFIKVELMADGYVDPYDDDRFAHPLGMWMNLENGSFHMWGDGLDGNTYLLSCGKDVLHFAYKITIADGTTNDYMDADIDISLDYKAAQFIPQAALEDAFGFVDEDLYTYIDFDAYSELVMYSPDGDGTTMHPFTAGAIANTIAKISEMPDSTVKTRMLELLAG